MSVELAPSGKWRVRWRDPSKLNKHGKPSERNRSFVSKREAERFDAKMKDTKASGQRLPTVNDVDLDASFSDVGKLWREAEAVRANWTEGTANEHETCQRLHLDPYIGSHVVRLMHPQDVLGLPPKLRAAGDSPRTIRRALQDARSILAHSMVLGLRTDNPASEVDAVMPATDAKPKVWPLTPEQIEAIRAAVLARRSPHALRDATMISVLAYGGLRPGEMRALRWSDWTDDGKLSIVRQIDRKGEEVATKRDGKADRQMVPWAPLIEDLVKWKAASQGGRDGFIFPGFEGGPMTTTEYSNWRKRVWAKHSGYPKPYVLRHSHASLRVRSGEDRTRVAYYMGHSVSTLEAEYSHHFKAFEGVVIVPEDLIRAARGEEPQQAEESDLSNLPDHERDLILAYRAKIAKDTAEAAAHDAEAEAAWDSVAV